MWFVNIFSQYAVCLSIFLNSIFHRAEVFHFDELHLHSSLMSQNIMPKNSLPSFRSRSVSPMFSSKSFRESIKVNFWIRCFSFYCIWMLNASSTICWKNYPFFAELLMYLVKNQWPYLCGSLFCPLIHAVSWTYYNLLLTLVNVAF